MSIREGRGRIDRDNPKASRGRREDPEYHDVACAFHTQSGFISLELVDLDGVEREIKSTTIARKNRIVETLPSPMPTRRRRRQSRRASQCAGTASGAAIWPLSFGD
jgi:hypothetical protein